MRTAKVEQLKMFNTNKKIYLITYMIVFMHEIVQI